MGDEIKVKRFANGVPYTHEDGVTFEWVPDCKHPENSGEVIGPEASKLRNTVEGMWVEKPIEIKICPCCGEKVWSDGTLGIDGKSIACDECNPVGEGNDMEKFEDIMLRGKCPVCGGIHMIRLGIDCTWGIETLPTAKDWDSDCFLKNLRFKTEKEGVEFYDAFLGFCMTKERGD